VGRLPRINEAGLTYHVWANGTSAQKLFRDAVDKNVMLTFLREEVKTSSWSCLAYVVMTTHYHLLLRLQKPTLSSGFQRLNLRYARYYNRRYALRGHAFEAPFQHKIVDGRFNELEVARYLAMNPIRAKMCEAPEDYPWSSYAAIIGLHLPDGIVDVRAALSPLDGTPSAYRAYVEQSDTRARWDQVHTRSRRPAATPRRRAAR
jgi:REP element-mobilizing transposase RayT